MGLVKRRNMKKITRLDVKKYFNQIGVGSIVTSTSMPNVSNISTVSWLIKDLKNSGHLMRVDRGKYQIVKRIPITRSKLGPRKNKATKDLSMIPSILKYNKEGMTIKEVRRIYKNLTPIDDQVSMTYFRRLFAFGQKEDIIVRKGFDEKSRTSNRGVPPVLFGLSNPNLSDEEWKFIINKFRMWLQEKSERKYKKKRKSKTIKEKFSCCGTIIDHFKETRDNPNKIYTEEYFIDRVYKRLNGELVKSFVVTGPDYFHHMDSLFTTISNRTLVCEIAPDVFEIIFKKAKICQYFINKKVGLLNCDVDEIAPVNCRYTDIDLMKTLKVNYKIISQQLMRQDLLCESNEEKYFTFTFTRRRHEDFSVTIDHLKKLLKDNLKADLLELSDGDEVRGDQGKLKSCRKCEARFSDKGRILEFHVFKYQDITPMMNVLISYK